MPAEVGEGKVKITPDTDGFGNDLESKLSGEATGSFGKLGTLAGNAFKLAAAAVVAGTVALAGGAAYAIGQASDLSESLSKNSAVFGDQAGAIEAWARTASTAFGQSTNQALGAATAYGNLFQAFGVGRDEAAGMSTSLTELAADLASFNNTSIDQALGALQSGITGETEPLKAYGVVINDVRLKHEALALGLIASTDEALTPAAKAQASYSLIMKDTALAQGDFARTSDGLANQQRILKAQLTDLAANIGTALLPMMTALAGFVIDHVVPALQRMGEWLSEHIPPALEAVRAALEPVIEWIRDQLPGALETARNAFDGFVGVIETVVGFVSDNWQVVVGAVTGLGVALLATLVPAFIAWATAAWAAAAAQIAAAAPVVLLVAALAALGAAVVYAYQNFEWFRNAVDAVAGFLRDTVWPVLQSVFGWLRDNVPAIIGAVVTALQNFWTDTERVRAILAEGFSTALSAARTAVDAVWTALQTAITWLGNAWTATDTFRGLLADGFKLALDVAKTAIDVLWTAVSTLITWVGNAWTATENLRGHLANAFSLGVGVAKAAIDLMWSALSLIVTWVGNAWTATEGIRAFFAGLFSTGVGIAKTAIDGVWGALQFIADKAQAAWDKTEGLRSFLEGAFKTGLGIAADAVGGIVGALETVLGFLNDIIGAAQTAVDWLTRVTGASSAGGIVSATVSGVTATTPSGTITTGGNAGVGGSVRSHEGGIVAGLTGEEVAMTLRAGEAVFTPQQLSALGRVIAGTASANRHGLPNQLTLVIEGRPFTAMIADYDRQTADMIGAGAR
jgi:phage-related protein